MSHRSALIAFVLCTYPVSSALAQEAAPAGAEGQASVSLTASGASTDASGVASKAEPEGSGGEPERELSRRQNGLDASTGLLRVVAADSDVTGTFRFSLFGSYFAGSEVLCPTCDRPDGTLRTSADDVIQAGTRLGVSFTPVAFLEGFAGLRYQSTENSEGDPKAVHIVGDANLGAKGFLPPEVDRLYGFGGTAEVLLTNQPGGVGIDAASFRLRALGTLDFDNRSDERQRLPLRAHLNIGYLFDNTGALADSIEDARAGVLGERRRITRVERFGHDINRVDSFNIGLGAEGTFDLIRPFAEWTVDIPVNRQGHVCEVLERSVDDSCLVDEGFSAIPSRITLGARAFPWYENWTRGLALLAAFDIGTGATSNFVEEIAPEAPWMVHVGLAYGFDTEPRIERQSVERVVEAVPPRRLIMGVVVATGTQQPIPGAIVRFEGQDTTGMVTNSEGKFVTGTLEPGAYAFDVQAEGFAQGRCQTELAASTPEQRDVTAYVECALEAVPQTANLQGVVRDAATAAPVAAASVKIVDPLGRSLTLTTDSAGAFRFENVRAGTSSITVSREGYQPNTAEYTLEPRKDRDVSISLQSDASKVVVTDKEIQIKEQIQFLLGSAAILVNSEPLIEEIAKALKGHPEILSIEVQGHTDNSGSREFNKGLSQRRAESVRAALIKQGVEASRLTAKGYGQEVPLQPNTTDRNRALNRRVQFVILQKR